MALFLNAYKRTNENEGGYVNDIDDNGGETLFGISRKFHGDDYILKAFWAELDNYKKLELSDAEITQLCKNNAIICEGEKTFYKKEFWDKMRGDEIKNQKLAENIYDFYVNAGKNAIICLQKLLSLKPDGVVGDITLNAINICTFDLNTMYVDARVKYYISLNQPKFEKGWINRAKSFL